MGNLFSVNKLDYCKGERPAVDCIICEIVRQSGQVSDLEVYRDELFLVSVNLFPYNSGHMMLCPLRHVEDPRQLSTAEQAAFYPLLSRCMDIVDRLYQPHGYNLGYNIGHESGASISHLHMHIVPRYKNELGFIDIVGGAKIIVEDPARTMARLREAFTAGSS